RTAARPPPPPNRSRLSADESPCRDPDPWSGRARLNLVTQRRPLEFSPDPHCSICFDARLFRARRRVVGTSKFLIPALVSTKMSPPQHALRKRQIGRTGPQRAGFFLRDVTSGRK